MGGRALSVPTDVSNQEDVLGVGTDKVTAEAERRRSVQSTSGNEKSAGDFVPDPKAPYAHSYYWASFVLIGNREQGNSTENLTSRTGGFKPPVREVSENLCAFLCVSFAVREWVFVLISCSFVDQFCIVSFPVPFRKIPLCFYGANCQ